MLLVADLLQREQAAAGQAGHLALHRSAARTGEKFELADGEAALRAAKKAAKHTLLGRGEKRIGKIGLRIKRGRLADPFSRLRAHIGRVSAQIGH